MDRYSLIYKYCLWALIYGQNFPMSPIYFHYYVSYLKIFGPNEGREF